MDGANPAGGAGENDIARQQRHVCGDEADQLCAGENHLAGVRVLAQLAVLEELNSLILRINFSFDERPDGRKGVEALGAGPLAFSALNIAIADVLRGGITKNVAARRLRGHVAKPPSNHNGQLGLIIIAVTRERQVNLTAIRDQRGGRLQPKERLRGRLEIALACVIGVVEAYGDYFAGFNRHQGADAAGGGDGAFGK